MKFKSFTMATLAFSFLMGTPFKIIEKAYAQQDSTVFNEACYLNRYPDVLNNWVKPGGKAIDHWNQHGKAEGRTAGCDATSTAPVDPTVFNEACYLQRYPDVVSNWVKPGGKALDHWNQHGKAEGRVPGCSDKSTPADVDSNVFNEACYLNRYPDVQNNWVKSGGKALDHWNKYGKAEGRIAGCGSSIPTPVDTTTVFNEACYIERYNDVKNGWVKNGGKAIDHWNQHGKAEGRIPGCNQVNPSNVGGNTTISANGITITTTERLAGAIGSLTWNGKEFINQDDHGRELQSASSFDNLGECFNPTEAGSGIDGTGAYSTSKILGIRASGNVLSTTTQMAFWLQKGEKYPQGCAGQKVYFEAQNQKNLSDHTLKKQVTIGYAGMGNVIEYLVTFHIPEHHNEAVIEALTGYMGTDFSNFFTLNPNTLALSPISDGPGEQGLPLILATHDENYAMGVYSPDINNPYHGYGRFNFFEYNTMKWNAVVRRGDTPPGDYSYRVYVVVGTVKQVTQSMIKLFQK